jgi:hypothetical protein
LVFLGLRPIGKDQRRVEIARSLRSTNPRRSSASFLTKASAGLTFAQRVVGSFAFGDVLQQLLTASEGFQIEDSKASGIEDIHFLLGTRPSDLRSALCFFRRRS